MKSPMDTKNALKLKRDKFKIFRRTGRDTDNEAYKKLKRN